MSAQNTYKAKYIKWKRKYLDIKNGGEIILGKDNPKFLLENTFPIIKDVDRNKTKVVAETIRTMAGNEGTNMISDLIKDRLGSNIIITFTTPDFGSDLINMAFRFQKFIVLSDNKNVTVDEALKHNIDLFDLNRRVKILNQDILSALKKTEQEVIYVDAFFLKNKNGQAFIDNKEISELVNLYKERTKMFIFRVPINYDFNNMFEETKGTYFEVIRYKKNKVDFYIIIIMTNQFKDIKLIS